MIDRDIAARVAAYRGNPEALMQQYQQSQNLLDLLALQKIKSEKEAAMRDMQLKMAQSGKPPTIAQQREQEVLAMTKDELLKQQRGLLDRKQQAQQEAIQELAAARNPAAGVPTLPTPDVMPEQAMAAGGIVAFAEGGAEWDKVNRDYAKGQSKRDEERFRILSEELRDARRRMEAGDPRAAGDVAALQRDMRRMRPAADPNAGIGALIPAAQAAEPKPTTQARRTAPAEEEAIYDPMTGVQISGPAPKPSGRVLQPGEKYEPNLIRDIFQGRPKVAPQAPATPPVVEVSGGAAPAAAPEQDGIDNIIQQAQARGAQPTPEAAPAAQGVASDGLSGLQALVDPYVKSLIRPLKDIDPEEEGRRRRIEYYQGVGLPMEREMQAARDRLTEYQKRQEEIAKEQRRRAFFDALAGAGGATFQQTLGGIGRDISAAQTRAEQAELQRIKDRNLALQGLSDADVKLREAIFGKGEAARTAAEGRQEKARTEAGLGIGRSVEKLKAEISAETNRLAKEGLDISKAQSILSNAQLRMQDLERKLDSDFESQYGMLLLAERQQTPNKPMDPAQKKVLDDARDQLELKKLRNRQEIEAALAPAKRSLGIPTSVTSLTPEENALINKYKNKQ